MLLLIDAGNTRIKWALAAPEAVPGTWLASGAVAHDAISVLGSRWRNTGIRTVLISNVAGSALRAALEAQLQPLVLPADNVPPVDIGWFASVGSVAGVRNHYREPSRLGCDRLAALVGARALKPEQALVVATCGTATTIDALTAEGDFIGGMILPGLNTMMASLALHTAQLPDITACASAGGEILSFASNTAEAIRSGCLSAQSGAIERAVAAHGNALCLLSGGTAAWIMPYLKVPAVLIDNLVLTGLHVVACSQVRTASGNMAASDLSGPGIAC